MCRILCVSEAGYYKYKRNLGKPGKDETLSAAIKSIIAESEYYDNLGVPRMQLPLMQRNIKAGIRCITRLMREMGLIQDGKLYISPIMDCCNGEILSLCMDSNMKKELCIETFRGVSRRYNIKGAICHSDRGSQYTSEAFRSELEKSRVLQSLSGVDHCYDNSRMESFFATLKKELLYRIPTYRMKRDTVKTIIFRYVFIYYNQMRVYTSNPEGLLPVVYRRLLENQLSQAA